MIAVDRRSVVKRRKINGDRLAYVVNQVFVFHNYRVDWQADNYIFSEDLLKISNIYFQ